MEKLIYNTLVLVYGGGMADGVAKFARKMWEALNELMEGNIGNAYSIFSAVAAALLVLYFYMDLASQASRDLLTLEKLVGIFIKFIIAFVILINVQTIMVQVTKFGYGIFDMVDNASMSLTTTKGDEGVVSGNKEMISFDEYAAAKSDDDGDGYIDELYNQLDSDYGGITHFLNGLTLLLPCLLSWIVNLGCKFVCYFAIVRNAMDIVVRGFLSPLAIPQLFEEGQRSSGVRYIKIFAATCLEMAVIVVCFKAASLLATVIQVSLFGAITESGNTIGLMFYRVKDSGIIGCDVDNIGTSLDAMHIIMGLLPSVVAAGMAGGTSKFTRDIVGS